MYFLNMFTDFSFNCGPILGIIFYTILSITNLLERKVSYLNENFFKDIYNLQKNNISLFKYM